MSSKKSTTAKSGLTSSNSVNSTSKTKRSTAKTFLSIIIVNYNTYDLTRQTIESLEREFSHHPSFFKKNTFEIIVVDNQSLDGSGAQLQRLSQKQTRFKFVQAPNNGGFAQGNLYGYQASRGEVILLLNSDTVVIPDSLKNLISFYLEQKDQKNNIGILGCQLRNHDDGLLQPQGGDRPSLLSVASQMLFLDDIPLIGRYLPTIQRTGRRAQLENVPDSNSTSTKNQLTILGWVGGTAMSFRRQLIDQVGFLDPNIFMYGEDVEFCYRTWQKTKQVTAVFHPAPIIHYGSASSSSKNAILGELKGDLYLWQKHFPFWQIPLLRLILAFGCFLRYLIYSFFKPHQTKKAIYGAGAKLAFTYRPSNIELS